MEAESTKLNNELYIVWQEVTDRLIRRHKFTPADLIGDITTTLRMMTRVLRE